MTKSFSGLRCAVLFCLDACGHAEQCGCQLRVIIALFCHPLLHTSSAQLEWQRPRPFIMTSCGVIYSLSDSPLLVAAYWCSKSMQSVRITFCLAILLLLLFSSGPFHSVTFPSPSHSLRLFAVSVKGSALLVLWDCISSNVY